MKIRKGKNIYFKLSVYKGDNSPEDFSKASDVKVVITGNSLGRSYVPDVEIEGNILSFEFPGTKNEYPGTYGISLSYTKKNPNSVTGIEPFFLDKPNAFTVVNLSKNEDLKQAVAESDMVTLSISGSVNAPRDGIDGITPHIGENGNWFLGEEDTGKPSRGKAFASADFTAEEIEGLQRPATEAADRADEATKKSVEQTRLAGQATDKANSAAERADTAVAGLDAVVEEQNKKVAYLEGLVLSLFNPLALKHYNRVVADGGTIFASYKELSDWFDKEGISEDDMDGTGEFQLIRIDPYYTGVRIDPSSTEDITYINKAYSVSQRFDMVMYSVNKPMELTKDFWLRRDINEKQRGIKTPPIGFYFKDLYYSVTSVAEEFDTNQLPQGHYPNVCPIIGTFHLGIGAGFNYTYTPENRLDTYTPKIIIRFGSDGYVQNTPTLTPLPLGKEFKMELSTSDMKTSFFINGNKVASHFTPGLIESDFLLNTCYDPIGIVAVADKGYSGGTPMGGSVRFRDFTFRFKEYIDPNSIMLLSLDGPVNEPFTEEEIKYLEEQQLNTIS